METIRLHSAIKEMVEALSQDETLAAQTTAGIHRHRLPTPPSSTPWSRIVVRQLLGLELQQRDGFLLAPLQVAIQVSGYTDPDLILEAMHENVRRVLESLTITSQYGSSLLPIERWTVPSAPVYDEQTASYVSAATYLTPLKP